MIVYISTEIIVQFLALNLIYVLASRFFLLDDEEFINWDWMHRCVLGGFVLGLSPCFLFFDADIGFSLLDIS